MVVYESFIDNGARSEKNKHSGEDKDQDENKTNKNSPKRTAKVILNTFFVVRNDLRKTNFPNESNIKLRDADIFL